MASDEERAAAENGKRLAEMLSDPDRANQARRELKRLVRAADSRWTAEHVGGDRT